MERLEGKIDRNSEGERDGERVAGDGAGGRVRGQITNHVITFTLPPLLYFFFTFSLLLCGYD